MEYRYASQLDASFEAMDLVLSDEVMQKIKDIQLDIMYPMG